MLTAADSEWMAQALHLAERGLYTTTPNPRVGCVLVKHGELLAEGWHERAGEAHAEVHALRNAGAEAKGATAYVTLEPCSHHGRTPPCADALIAAGVSRVVVAMQDPNPQVAGQGIARFQSAGIAVDCGLMESAARALNAGFIKRMTQGMPLVRSKIAMSLDGRTALNNGVSQWITTAEARRDGQRWRARSCAVLTGIGTVLADDAQLNVREVETSRQPLRVVLDSELRMPVTARILNANGTPSPIGGGLGERVLVYSAVNDALKIARLENTGAKVIVLPSGNGQVDLVACLKDLAARGCNEILFEAGRTLNGALLKAGLIDELVVYLAPQLLGDMARGMAQLGELSGLDQCVQLVWQDVRQIGKDLRIIANINIK
jgi:diaminohydroxyphosphoribosylaminopyrimidine deaminase/5-amino-6-(5-phosphoribosylamino)uracil reductase